MHWKSLPIEQVKRITLGIFWGITWEYNEHLYAMKLNNTEEVEKFLEHRKLQKLIQKK